MGDEELKILPCLIFQLTVKLKLQMMHETNQRNQKQQKGKWLKRNEEHKGEKSRLLILLLFWFESVTTDKC